MDYEYDTNYPDAEPTYTAPRPQSRRSPLRIMLAEEIGFFLLLIVFALLRSPAKKDNPPSPTNATAIIGKWQLSDNAIVNFVKNGIVFREPPPDKNAIDRSFENKNGRLKIDKDMLTINWDGVIFKGRDVYKITKLTEEQFALEHQQNGAVLTGARVH